MKRPFIIHSVFEEFLKPVSRIRIHILLDPYPQHWLVDPKQSLLDDLRRNHTLEDPSEMVISITLNKCAVRT
jgi:hypothetical protein